MINGQNLGLENPFFQRKKAMKRGGMRAKDVGREKRVTRKAAPEKIMVKRECCPDGW